jgi:energy-converting hydrogenase B subunit D
VIVATIAPLQALAFVLPVVAATAVVLSRDTSRQIVLNGIYGTLLVILFVVLAAPDVALSMLTVSTVGYPLVVLIAIARSKK